MSAAVGTLALALAFGLALWGAVAAVVGGRTRRLVLIESARTSAYSLVAMLVVANVAMEWAILRNDFSIRYVAENSSRATPVFFKFLSLWGADAGSLLLWNLVLAGYIATVAFRFRHRRPETFSWAMGTMYGVAAFYLMLVLGPTRPFEALAQVPADGRGPLPLLQNHPLMAAHPPFLYLGFIGFTVPFAFAIASLVTGRLTDEWIRITRRWTLASWLFLLVGLLLGGLWSYGVLGWGGYWAWDPVENVALLPWLTSTAFLHSVMVEERRGMLKVWNLCLIISTFALTVLGTFLTRGSILYSVHSFAQSIVGPLYLGFLAVVLLVGFGLMAARSHLLRSEGTFDTVLSRESAFMGNNLGLVAITFTVLVGTIYPLLAQAISGRRVSVGAPYFNQTTIPVLLLLLFLMAIGPLLPWKAGSAAGLRRRVQAPALLSAGVAGVLALLGLNNVGALVAFTLASFVIACSGAEIYRAARVHRSNFAGGRARALLTTVRRNPRLHGGLIIHAGLAMAAIAITASSSFDQKMDVTLNRGETARFAGYTFRFDGTRNLREPQRRSVVANITLLRDGQNLGRLTPRLNFYPASQNPIGTPSIRVGGPGNRFTDVYLSLSSVEASGEPASFRIYMNPGVIWLWIGGAVMTLGGLLALWPSRKRRVQVSEAVEARPEKIEVLR